MTDSSLLPESNQLEQIAQYCFHEKPKDTSSEPIGVFYAVRNENLRPTKVYYHKFGTPVNQCDDKLVFESKNDMYTVGVGLSTDGKYIMINYHSKTDTEIYSIDVEKSFHDIQNNSDGKGLGNIFSNQLHTIRTLIPDIEYRADHGGDSWFLFTKEGCKKEHFLVMRKRDVKDSDFTVLIPEDPELCLNSDGAVLTKSYLGVTYLNTKTGQPKLLVLPNDIEENALESSKKQVYFPNVDPETTSHDASFSHTTNYSNDWITVAVDTPITPTIWYKYPTYGCSAKDLTVVKTKEVPNFNPELYATERVYVKYKEDQKSTLHPSVIEAENKAWKEDGIVARSPEPSIPVTILYKKDKLKKDGSMPLLLNGYGSYGIAEEPVWSNLDTLYADLGFVVATAHIRGGGDLGEPWYQAAKYLTKKRTFNDFVNTARYLSKPQGKEQWTSSGNIAIVGGSAGGMLVGACLNQDPSLFRAIVAHVPFVTVLDTMLDGDLPLTPGEFKEWGNPREPAFFDYMREYCPYEQVNAKSSLLGTKSDSHYPSIFATTGLSDYRVGYYEGAKWIAKIRSQIKEAKAESGSDVKEPLVVMETNMAAGHGGASGRFDRLKEVSRDVAFLATEFGLIE